MRNCRKENEASLLSEAYGEKQKRQQPQVASRKIPTGFEGVAEQEQVQQVAQRDHITSILSDSTL